MGMLERGGDIVTEVVPDRKTKTLAPHIVDHVEQGSEVHTVECPFQISRGNTYYYIIFHLTHTPEQGG